MADRAHNKQAEAERHTEAEQQAEKQAAFNFSGVTAGALASVAAAFFTSRLGVAGTLIGAALTSILITTCSAIARSSLEKASGKLSGATRKISGLSTQRVRVPGTAAPPQEEDAGSSRRSRRARHHSGPYGRLSTAFANFGRLPMGVRRRVLVAGLGAGVVAFAIGLLAITGIETVIGEPLSSVGRGDSNQPTETSSGGTAPSGSPGTTLGRFVGAVSGTSSDSTSNQQTPASDEGTPSDGSGTPGQGTPSGGTPDQGTPGQDDSGTPGGDVTPTPQQPQQPQTPDQPQTPQPQQPSSGGDVQQPSQQPSGGQVQQPAAQQPAAGSQ